MLVLTLISIQSKTFLIETEDGQPEPSNRWIEQLGEVNNKSPDWGSPPINGNRRAPPRPSSDPPPFLPMSNRGLGESSSGDRGNPPPVNRGLGESSSGDRGNPPPIDRGLGESSSGDRGNPPPINRGLADVWPFCKIPFCKNRRMRPFVNFYGEKSEEIDE